jgi:hypothetical protein
MGMNVAKQSAVPATPTVKDIVSTRRASVSAPTTVQPNCEAVESPDGSLTITLRIDPIRAKRLHTRRFRVPLDTYLWDNVFNRALEDATF